MKLVEVYDEYLLTNFGIYLPDPPPPTQPGGRGDCRQPQRQ